MGYLRNGLIAALLALCALPALADSGSCASVSPAGVQCGTSTRTVVVCDTQAVCTCDGGVMTCQSPSGGSGDSLAGPSLIVSKRGSLYVAQDGQTHLVVLSNADFSTLLQSAVNYLNAFGGEILITRGSYPVLSTVLFAPFYTATLSIVGEGAGTVLTLGAAGFPLFSVGKTDDYDVFRHITLEGFTVDAAAATTSASVLCCNSGPGIDKVSWEDWTVRDVRLFNIPTSTVDPGAVVRWGINIKTANSTATETHATNMLFENVTIEGGNAGIVVGGASLSGNHTVDAVTIRGLHHDTGVSATVSTAFDAANINVGVASKVGTFLVEDSYLRGSGDVGIEFDDCQNCIARNNTVVNPYNGAVLCKDRRADDGDTNCTVQGLTVIQEDGNTRAGGAALQSSISASPTCTGCSVGTFAASDVTVLNNDNAGGFKELLLAQNVPARSITVQRARVLTPALAAGGDVPFVFAPILGHPDGGRNSIRLEDVEISTTGSIGGGNRYEPIFITGENLDVTLSDVRLPTNITGVTPGTSRLFWIGDDNASLAEPLSVTLRADRIGVPSFAGADTAPIFLCISDSTELTPDFLVVNPDVSHMPASYAKVGCGDTTNYALVRWFDRYAVGFGRDQNTCFTWDIASTDPQICWDETDDRLEASVNQYGFGAKEFWLDRVGTDTERYALNFSSAGSLQVFDEEENVVRQTWEQTTRSVGINESAPEGYLHITKKSDDPASGTDIIIAERCGADAPQIELWDSSNLTAPACSGTAEQKWALSINSSEQFVITNTTAGTNPLILDDATGIPTVAAFTAAGFVCSTSGGVLSSSASVCSGASAATNSFETMNAPAGTDPVADSPTDTLNLTTSSGILVITGTAGTDTLDFVATEVDGSTTNELQNIFQTVDATSGTDPVADSTTDTLTITAGTGITVTGDSTTDTITIAATGGGASNSFETWDAPAGTDPVADSSTDTMALAATGIVTITGSSAADSLTFGAVEVDGSTTNEIQNLFETINAPSGTDPVADGATDTLNLTAGGILTITGTSGTDTVDFTATEAQLLFQTFDAPAGTDPVADTVTDTLTLAVSGIATVTGNSGTDTLTIGAVEAQNLFQTVDATSGTDPVADTITDTLTLTAGTGITVTGDSTTDTITIAATGVATNSFQTIDTSSGTDPVADTSTDTLALTGTSPITVTGADNPESATIAIANAAADGATKGAASFDPGDFEASAGGNVTFDRTATVAGNPGLPSNGVVFSTTGILFEGVTGGANNNETVLTVDDPSVDRTLALPNESGTLCSNAGGCLSSGYQAGPLTGDVVTSGTTATIQANAVALTTDTTGNYAAGDAEAGNALTGDTATAFFSAGALEVARGGTGAAPAADDQVPVSSSTSAAAWTTIPDSSAATSKMQYNPATNSFAAGTDDDVPEAGDFGTLALTGDVTSSGLATTVAANAVALTTDTTGNYVQSVATTAPLSGGAAGSEGAVLTLTIADALADGATEGAASFTAADFDATAANISIDYTNGQAATTSLKGFLTAADWTTFNAKQAGPLSGDVVTSGAVATIQTNSVALTTDTTGNYALGDAEGGAATTGDSATAFFSAGLLEVAIGGTGSAPASDDQVLVSSSTSAAAWKTVPDTDGAGLKLVYDQGTNAFQSATDDDVPEGGDFGNLSLSGDVSSVGLTTSIGGNKVTGAMIALGSDATGDVMYYGGTDWQRLAAGTAGHVLHTNGAAAPTWSADSTTGISYVYDTTSTADADPGSGRINANVGATVLYVDDSSAAAVDVQTWIATWDDQPSAPRGYLWLLQTSASGNKGVMYSVSGASIEATGYWKIAVSAITTLGAIDDEAAITLAFSATPQPVPGGDKELLYNSGGGVGSVMAADPEHTWDSATNTETTGSASALSANDNLIIFDGTAMVTGTHTAGASSTTVLTDSTKSWITNQFVGFDLRNTTDVSIGQITSNTATTATVAWLSGGAENDFDTGEAYAIDGPYFQTTSWTDSSGGQSLLRFLPRFDGISIYSKAASGPIFSISHGYGTAAAGSQGYDDQCTFTDGDGLTIGQALGDLIVTSTGVTIGGLTNLCGNFSAGAGLFNGTIETQNVQPKTDSTYSLGIVGKKYLDARIDRVYVGPGAPSSAAGTTAFSTTQLGNTAATETDLWSDSTDASTLTVNGDGYSMWAAGTFGATVSTDKRIRVKYGGTTIYDSGALTAAESQAWKVVCDALRTGAATQKASCTIITSGTPTGLNKVTFSSPTETLSGAVILKVTGAGTNASDVVFEQGKQFWVPGS